MDLVAAILQMLSTLYNFRLTFLGIFVGLSVNFVFERFGPEVVGDPVYAFVAAFAFLGLVLDIRRAFKD